ncbi:MAG: hypothetical protein ACLQFW_18995 [Xanthobacteraceae bacterium]
MLLTALPNGIKSRWRDTPRGYGYSTLAKLEAQKISERTKAGMARAKAKGISVGRPKLGIEIRQQIAGRAANGETPYGIAKALGIDRHTAAKYAS